MKIPALILRQLYTYGSLQNLSDGIRFSIKNRLSDATVTRLSKVLINGAEIPLDALTLELKEGRSIAANLISPDNPLPFPLREIVHLRALNGKLPKGKHHIELEIDSAPFGRLKLKVEDAIAEERPRRLAVPHDKDDNYGDGAVAARQRFIEEFAGVRIQHLNKYSF